MNQPDARTAESAPYGYSSWPDFNNRTVERQLKGTIKYHEEKLAKLQKVLSTYPPSILQMSMVDFEQIIYG